MKISVIIPTYKPQAYLWECLDSLVSQTFPKEDFEVILVLNGCTEPWKSQIEEYVKKNKGRINVNLIHTKEGGVSNARNIALQTAIGEYVTFIDDDDYVSPRYLECLLESANKSCVTVSDSLSFIDGTSIMIKEYEGHKVYKDRLGKANTINTLKFFFQGPVRKLMHRSILEGRKFDVSLSNGEDSLYMFLVSDRINEVKLTAPEAVYYRRLRDNSANFRKQTLSAIVKNRLYLIKEYTRIYFSHPFRYNALFYLTRVLGSLNTIIRNII